MTELPKSESSPPPHKADEMSAASAGDTLERMNPTGRFSDRAKDYGRYRPDYPALAIDAVLEDLGDPASLVAADIGAGTGISSRLLADRGVRVLAVEPNAEMRTQALAHPRIEWRAGTAEETGLLDASVDLIVCAQAFHWFRHAEALREFHRILRPGGRLVLMWNSRDRSDPMTRGYTEAIRAVEGEDPLDRRDAEVVGSTGHFTSPTLVTFAHRQELDLPGLIGRALSASYVPKRGPAFERLEQLLGDLFERHRDTGGRIALRYVTEVYRAERR